MSEMEKDARDLLYKTLMTLSIGALWMLLNMTIGIYAGWFFFENSPKLGNYICYVFFLGSLAWVLRYFYKLWK
ncbi:hypothetical protein [Flavihumibacter sp. UBA7668]|uniref:hypothetical protein n=1 Tax=Flavihumibacter sp. UBA7668 TaxID=1946542 RepID=UPI0025C3EBF4|nr:hypothetical protein [Flavihumibacter sp. UBA7668]